MSQSHSIPAVTTAEHEQRTLAWGIIGCGDVTEVKSGPAFNKLPRSRVAAVMRRDAAKAEDYARRHGVPRWYADADLLLEDPEVNAIYVATPPDTHAHYALRALASGRPVYLEKPMARDAAEAASIFEASLRYGQKLCVAHYRRAQPLFRQVKQLLEDGAVGKPQLIELLFTQPYRPSSGSNWRLRPEVSGGGLFHDLAPHQLDLLLHFFGPPLFIGGAAGNTAGVMPVEDTVSGHAVFGGGILFSGTWCFTHPLRQDRCTITGSEGQLQFSIFDHQPIRLTRNNEVKEYGFDRLEHVQQPMIEKVVRYFLDGNVNPCPAGDGLEVMRMMDALTAKH